LIEVLTSEEAAKLDAIFASEWDAEVPADGHILAATNEGELVAFLTLEEVVLASNVYVAPNHRGMSGARALRALIERAHGATSAAGRSVLMVRHANRANHFVGQSRRLGFRKYGDAVFRADY